MRHSKGVSAILVSVFLIIIAVALTGLFIVFSRGAQDTLQEGIEEGVEREAGEIATDITVASVADNEVIVQNRGRKAFDTSEIDILVDGSPADVIRTSSTLGPGRSAVFQVQGFLPGMHEIRVSGPFGVSDDLEAPLLYPGAAAFWDFLPGDEGTPRDLTEGGSDGRLNGTTVLAMHFDESRGDVAADVSGHGNDGHIVGAGWTSGVSRSALEMDGVDDYAQARDAESLDFGTSDFTIGGWFKSMGSNSLNQHQTVVAKLDAETPTGWKVQKLLHGSPGALNFRADSGNVIIGDTIIEDNRWYHFTVTRDGSDVTLYLDGAIDGTGTSSIDFTNSDPLRIGKMNPTYESHFNGVIDEIELHTRALSHSEITQRVDAERALFSDYVEGIHNSALRLDGEDSHVRVEPTSSLNLFESLTIEAWVKMESGNTDHDTVLVKDGSYGLWIDSTTDTPVGQVWIQGGSPVTLRATENITRGRWNHVVVTAGDNTVTMYVNGEPAGEAAYFGNIPFTETPALIGVHSLQESGGTLDGALNGELEYVALYDEALTREQVRTIYEAS